MKSITKILIFTGLILLGGIIFACISLNKSLEPRPRPTPAPISPYIKEELCETLDYSRTESFCLTPGPILAVDTFVLFEKTFTPYVTTEDDVVNSLNPSRVEKVVLFQYPRDFRDKFHQYDLAGTGVNRIITQTNHKNIVTSVVFIRADVLTPLPQETVADLCQRLDQMSAKPCNENRVIYAQDFFPLLKEHFLNKTADAKLFSPLTPYLYEEAQRYYKLFYRYNDNVFSRVVFYFDETKKLENIAFVGDFLPTPLDPEVLSDLCQKLQIDLNADKCMPNAKTYTTDLRQEIRDAFPIGKATYEDVQNILAKYQYGFDYPVRDGNGHEVTLSWYDLVGNNYTRIRFDFDNDFIVESIQFFSGGSS